MAREVGRTVRPDGMTELRLAVSNEHITTILVGPDGFEPDAYDAILALHQAHHDNAVRTREGLPQE